MQASSRITAAVVLLGTTLLVLGLAAPRVPTPSPHSSGDAALAADVDRLRPPDSHRLVVVRVSPDGRQVAGFGADERSDLEIGSISKAMTGMLLADAVDRGEVTLDTRLGDLLDLDGAPAADVTLVGLATHRSGLPRLPGGPGFVLRSIWSNYSGSNPYGGITTSDLVDAARTAELSSPGEYAYSNFGAALLGQALAARAGMPFAELLRERITEPLGMVDTYAPVTPELLRPDALRGLRANGRPSDPWIMDAFAPAGGVRSTAADLARLAEALLDGTAPGATSLDLVDGVGDPAMGLAWHGADGREDGSILWHNGGTGGFSAIIAVDRGRGEAVIALGDVTPMNTDASVDPLAAQLLTGTEDLR